MATPATVTVTLSADDDADEIEVPRKLLDLLSEGEEPAPAVVADIAMLGLAQQAHGAVHHSHGETSEEVEAAESLTMDLFEERFGQTYGEMTGHSH
jgi:hypothetical protein